MIGTWRLSRRWSLLQRAFAGVTLAACPACDDAPSKPALEETPDAAVCERGTEGCSCISGGGCRNGLLCIVGRCLVSQAEDLPDEPPRNRPMPPSPMSPSAPGVDEDAGTVPVSDGGPGDGGLSDEAGAADDGGAPTSAADASL